MEYVRYKPCPPLDAFVEYLWSLSDAPPHAKEMILPSGTLELVINLAEDEIRVYSATDPARSERYAGAVVSGAFDRRFVVDTREHASIVGVHFWQGGAAPFLAVPADRLANAHVHLADLWSPGEVTRLRDRLCAARSNAMRFQLLEQALIGRLCRPREHQRLIYAALDQMRPARTPVRDVVSTLGISHRHFIELFGREVGLTPKMYLRVQRFQRAMAMATRTAEPHWPHLAQRCGYFDQAHMIRDFQAFAGLTPTQYLGQRSAQVKDNHVPFVQARSKVSKTGSAQGSR